MNRLLIAMVMLLLAGMARAGDAYIPETHFAGTVEVASSVTIGPVTIHHDGEVEIEEGTKLTETSWQFWKCLREIYPAMFTPVVTNYVTVTNYVHVFPLCPHSKDNTDCTVETNRIDTVTNSIVVAPRTVSTNTDFIRELVTKGQICAAIGHKWESGCGMFGCCVLHYGNIRHCTVCGKTETQALGDWK